MENSSELKEASTQTLEIKEATSSLTERTLSNIDVLLKEKGIEYFVVGSVARRAYMGIPVNDRSEIDVLIPQNDRLDEAKQVFGLVQSRNFGIEIDSSLSDFFHKEGDMYKLKRGQLEYTLDSSTVQEIRVSTGTAAFSTLPPETLLHTYVIAGSQFRPKDWKNALEFGRWVRDNVNYDHDYQVPFHNFAKAQWEQSPLRKVQFKWREYVRNMPQPARKFLLQNVYQHDTVKAARTMFNNLEKALCGRKT